MDDYREIMRPLFDRLSEHATAMFVDEALVAAPTMPHLLSVVRENAESQVAQLYKSAMKSLETELLAHIYAQTPNFFENLIVDLLLAMGYGSRRRDLSKRLGQSHDGGIDGLISQDELGLEVILLQAKRLKPNTAVSVSQVRDFVGSLETRRATKGVFVTTGNFTVPARMIVQEVSSRIVLINGSELVALMIRHNLGVKISESYVFKNLDIRYFSSLSA